MNYTLGKLSSCLPHLIPASSARAQTHADILPIHWNLPTPLPWKRLALMTDNDKHFYVIETPSLFSSQQKKEKNVDGPADSGVNLYGHGYLLHVVTAAVHNSKVGSSQTTRFASSLFCWPFLRSCSVFVWLVWRIWQRDIEPFPEWAGTAGLLSAGLLSAGQPHSPLNHRIGAQWEIKAP